MVILEYLLSVIKKLSEIISSPLLICCDKKKPDANEKCNEDNKKLAETLEQYKVEHEILNDIDWDENICNIPQDSVCIDNWNDYGSGSGSGYGSGSGSGYGSGSGSGSGPFFNWLELSDTTHMRFGQGTYDDINFEVTEQCEIEYQEFIKQLNDFYESDVSISEEYPVKSTILV
jgi:hypothetical protein